MFMRPLVILILSLISVSGICQSPDTLIYAQGKIVNGVTKELVAARISYASLPYGNKVGIASGSSFLFPLFDNEKYSITVEAAGFAPSKYLLDPAEANAERRVIRDIELHLPDGAANNAETTHTVGKVLRLNDLIFQTGSSTIEASSYKELNEVVVMLNNNPKMIIQLEGHTDFVGNAKLNLKLSQERVDAVKNYLKSHGSDPARIKTKAYGGSRPISRENTEEARSMNRRVELRILKN
jgi:outer membrane protein OmpA-like peptidoglycan-associated protein